MKILSSQGGMFCRIRVVRGSTLRPYKLEKRMETDPHS